MSKPGADRAEPKATMTGVIATIPRIQFSNALGLPLAGGKLTTYLAGTTTPEPTYQDQDLTIANPTTITLDSTGSCVLWLDPEKSYKFLLKSALGVTQPGWPVDNIVGASTPLSLTPTLSAYAKLTTLATAIGAALVGFAQAGIGAAKRLVQDKLREAPVTPQDYADLVFMANAKSPGDGKSHYAVNFESWRTAIQRALDVVSERGGGTVLIPYRAQPYLIDDYLKVGANTRLVFEGTVKLADYTTIGAILVIDDDNVMLDNPLLDGSDIYAGGSGQNGIGIISGNHIRISGGHVKNCHRGEDFVSPGSPNDGGKGVQIEHSAGEDIVIDGLALSNCFMAMSTIRDGTGAEPYYGILYSNIKADNCDILFFVKQSNIVSTDGLQHTVQLNNFYAVNCGSFEGAFQFSRASHVLVANGIVVNTSGVAHTSLIRGTHRYCRFKDVMFTATTDSIVNLEPGTYCQDNSYDPEQNDYDIQHIGTVNFLINSITRPLKNSTGRFQLQNDVGTAFFGYPQRNGNSTFTVSQGGKTAIVGTNTNFNLSSGAIKFSQLPLNFSIPGLQPPSGTWTPVDGSPAALSLAGSYGDYIKNGDVSAAFRVSYPANASAEVAKISGLPFAMANKAGRVMRGFSLGFTNVGFPISAIISNGGDSSLVFVKMDGTLVKNSELSEKTVDGIITYFPA